MKMQKKKNPTIQNNANRRRAAKNKLVQKNIPVKKAPKHTKRGDTIVLEKKFEHMLNETQIKELSVVAEVLRAPGILSEKHFADLKKNVRYLFKQLTSERSERYENYLNQDATLYAYSYYYLPWNCYKLIKLFLHVHISELLARNAGTEKNRDHTELSFADFGSGPLTLVIALWIAEPKLRAKKINWYCYDLSAKALDLGEKIFTELAKRNKRNAENWTIKKIPASFYEKQNKKYDAYFSANMLNEFINERSENFSREIFKAAQQITNCLAENAFALIVEPGNPQGGKIIGSIRTEFLHKNFFVLSPCSHEKNCPLLEQRHGESDNVAKNNFTAAKGKWCHFTFKNSESIGTLDEISQSVNLAKEAVAFSYLFISNGIQKRAEKKSGISVRILSDMIKLPNGFTGRYACSALGFLLLKSNKHALIKGMHSGNVFRINPACFTRFEHDRKSGARIVEL